MVVQLGVVSMIMGEFVDYIESSAFAIGILDTLYFAKQSNDKDDGNACSAGTIHRRTRVL